MIRRLKDMSMMKKCQTNYVFEDAVNDAPRSLAIDRGKWSLTLFGRAYNPLKTEWLFSFQSSFLNCHD